MSCRQIKIRPHIICWVSFDSIKGTAACGCINNGFISLPLLFSRVPVCAVCIIIAGGEPTSDHIGQGRGSGGEKKTRRRPADQLANDYQVRYVPRHFLLGMDTG